MIKKLILFLLLYLPLLVYAEQGESITDLAELLSMDLESLAQQQIFTASRYATERDKTPAVVTVITADDIARNAYRSIHEVMEHVPGHFYNTSAGFENLTNRGISQTLTSFLLLIDGHAVNNRSAFGISVETVFPNLSDVERIEIVRGAGSVLWGTEAGLGVIHVITKSGRSLDKTGEGKLELFADYEFEHNRKIGSAIYGKRFDKGDLMASFKVFDSKAPHRQIFAGTPPVPVKRFNANWDFDPSYEFTFKSHWKEFGVKGQVTHFNNFNFDNSQLTEAEYYRTWIELTWTPQLTEHTRLESRLYYNDFETIYKHPRDGFDDLFLMEGGGAEAIIYHEADDFSVTVGAITEVHRLELESGFGTTSGSAVQQVPETTDMQLALFGEGTYRGFKDWQFTLGGRVQYNEGILEETQFLPRAAAIYTINDRWTAKYIFNRSEVAPTMEIWRNGIEGVSISRTFAPNVAGAEEQQRYDIHDLQLIYSDERFSMTASLFYIEVKDMIQFFNGTVIFPNGTTGSQRWINGPDVTSKGVQLEFTHQGDKIEFYGDYTYTDAKFDERFFSLQGTTIDLVEDRDAADVSLSIINTPAHQWNLGTDITIRPNLSLNLHYRGYTNLKTKFSRTPVPVFKNLGPEHFFDATLLWREVGVDDLDFTIYVKNITDNDAKVPDTVSGGFVESVLERRIGLSLKYSF